MRFTVIFAAALLLISCQQGSYDGSTSSADEPAQSTPASPAPVTDPFPDAAQVRLFVETQYPQDGNPAVYSKTEGLLLTELQRADFENALRLTPMPPDMYACFIPHHFFRYFDQRGQQIGEVEVCFCCEGVVAHGSELLNAPDGMIVSADYAALKQLVEALGEPTDLLCE